MGQSADEMRRDDQPHGTTTGASTNDPARIEHDIERTRADMGETIDALQERLAPQHLKEQAKETARAMTGHAMEEVKGRARDTIAGVRDATVGTAKEAPTTVIETIKQNPLPAALVGIGLGWLWMNRQSSSSGYRSMLSRSYGAYPEMRYPTAGQPAYSSPEHGGSSGGQLLQHGREMVSDKLHAAQQQAGGLAHQTGEQAGHLAGQAQHQYRRAEDRAQQTMQQNPLATGAVALALGVAVGLLLPETRKEQEMMGEARDHLLARAQSAAQDTMHKAQHIAQEAAQEAQQTAKDEAHKQGLTS